MGSLIDPELEKLKTEYYELSDKICNIEFKILITKDDEVKNDLRKKLISLKEKQNEISDKKSEIERYIDGYVRIEAVIACFIGVIFFVVAKEDNSMFSSVVQFVLTMASIVFLAGILFLITYAMSSSMNKVHTRKKSGNERRKDSVLTTVKASAIFLAVVYVFMFLVDMI